MYLIISKTEKIKRNGNAVWTETKESPIKCYKNYIDAKENLKNIIKESTLDFKYIGNRFWSCYSRNSDSVKDNCKYRHIFKQGGMKEYYIKYIKES